VYAFFRVFDPVNTDLKSARNALRRLAAASFWQIVLFLSFSIQPGVLRANEATTNAAEVISIKVVDVSEPPTINIKIFDADQDQIQSVTRVVSVTPLPSPETNSVVSIHLQFSNQYDGVGSATDATWHVIEKGGDTPTDFNGIGSSSDFAGTAEIYRIDRVDSELAEWFLDPSKTNAVSSIQIVRYEDNAFQPAFVLKTNGEYFPIVRQSDPAPEATPGLPAGNFIDFGSYSFFTTQYFAFTATATFSGSGVYVCNVSDILNRAPKIKNIAPSRTSGIGKNIAFLGLAPDQKIYFTAENGFFRVDPAGGSSVELVTGLVQYQSGKKFNFPNWFRIYGTNAALQAVDPNGQPLILDVNLNDGKVGFVVGAGMPIPGETGLFSGAQRPLRSRDWLIYEGFKDFQYKGSYALNLQTGISLALGQRGDATDGRTLQTFTYEVDSLLGDRLGVVKAYSNNSTAGFLLTLPKLNFSRIVSLSAPKYSTTDGFSATVTVAGGESPGNVKIQFRDLDSELWQAGPIIRAGSFSDSSGVGQKGRIYRALLP